MFEQEKALTKGEDIRTKSHHQYNVIQESDSSVKIARVRSVISTTNLFEELRIHEMNNFSFTPITEQIDGIETLIGLLMKMVNLILFPKRKDWIQTHQFCLE